MRTHDGANSSSERLLPSEPSKVVKTQVLLNVYDILPPSTLSSFLWNIGVGCVHSGVVVGNKEYAYGAHQHPGKTGVYFTRPQLCPPGGTFKCEILLGFSLRSQEEIDEVVFDASQKFLGTEWHLLKNNCNHFSTYLCKELTGRFAPPWLNRAASLGNLIPCVIPQHWLQAPDAETEGSALLEDENLGQIEQNNVLKQDTGGIVHDEESDYEAHLMSDGSSTDDDMRAKWRRKRRSYKKPTNSQFLPLTYTREQAGSTA